MAGRLVLPWDTIVIPLRTASIRSRDSIEKSNAYLLLATLASFFFFFLSFFLVCANRPSETRRRNSSDFASSPRLLSPPLSFPRSFAFPISALRG